MTKDNKPETLDELGISFASFCASQGTPFGSMPEDNERLEQFKASLSAMVAEIIGKPIDIHGRSSIYESKSGTEGVWQRYYDLGTNGRIIEQSERARDKGFAVPRGEA
ncbi:hypothetical protein [Paeniglutamicibacter sp. NPDC091659]|uniref:hypothetical protein n=1 Tax=Paeniglutamicibacter sp. NPDC091659 TaxID=3364389 RepID=UPI00380784F6